MALQTPKLTYLRGVKKRPKVGSQQLAVVKRPRVAVAPIVKQGLAVGAAFYLGRATVKRPSVKAAPTTVRVPVPVPIFVDRPVPVFVPAAKPAAKPGKRPPVERPYERPGKRPPTAKATVDQFAGYADMQVIRDVPVTSSWVVSVQLVQFKGEPALAITFKGSKRTGPVTCLYPRTALRDFESILAAPSKGKWVWRSVYGKSYIITGG